MMLGNLHSKAGRSADAIAAYRRALEFDPDHEGAAFSLALAYKEGRRLDDAEAGFERVLALNPRNTKARFQLADLWMAERQFDRAEAVLHDALSLDVERAAFLVKLAECHIETRRFDEAERSLLSARALKPDQRLLHYDLGLVFEERGAIDAAIDAYEAELQISPRMYQAHFNLAKLLTKRAAHTRPSHTFGRRLPPTRNSRPASSIWPRLFSTRGSCRPRSWRLARGWHGSRRTTLHRLDTTSWPISTRGLVARRTRRAKPPRDAASNALGQPSVAPQRETFRLPVIGHIHRTMMRELAGFSSLSRDGGVARLACSPSPQPPVPAAARHLVFITIDTLRADRLGCYGNRQSKRRDRPPRG